jgi:hypothetical protein
MRQYAFTSTLFIVGIVSLYFCVCMLFKASGAEPLPDADPNWYTAKQRGPSIDEYCQAMGVEPEDVYEL